MEDQVTREIELDAAPEEVWEALTDPEQLAGWLGTEAEIEERPGGSLAIDTDDGPREGWVEECEPGRRLSIWWSDGDEDAARVQFDLEETPGGTRLVVTETRPLAALELELPRGPVMLAHA